MATAKRSSSSPGRTRHERTPRRRSAARLDAPLLVTDLTNILYLTGFDSSNAALIVEPGGGATLYTDFRYIESARAVEGVEVAADETRADARHRRAARSACSSRRTCCRTRSGSARAGRSSSCRRAASSRSSGRSRTRRRSRRSGARRGSRIAALEALTAETWVGRSEREIAWRLRELLHAHGADELSFDSDRRVRPERRAAARASDRSRSSSAGRSSTVDWGVRVDGYCSDCTRTFSTGRLPDRLREAYDVCLEAQ